MAIFSPRTFPVILQDMLAKLIASTPLNDVNFGSVLTTMLEAAAQEDDEQYFQMLEIVRAFSLDSIFGSDLDDRAAEYNITRHEAAEASTFVTIRDTAFTKVETGVYAGASGPAAGSTSVNGDSATGFPAAGSIIVGRGTPNVETLVYSSISSFGNFVRFNLVGATGFDHGTDETIILTQGGNRSIPAGTVVKVPASDTLEEVTFSTDAVATILDGESELTGVPVTASVPGTIGNVPIGAISRFDSKPFSTATVTNPSRVTNGRDEERDQELRDRIKDTIQSLSRGTGRAISTGILGLVSTAENKRVVSVSLRDTSNPAEVVKVFIDDGTGFVPSFARRGLETVVNSATGGEKFLDVANFPIMKAFVETQNAEPYNIGNNSTLFVEVNGVPEAITFVNSDFDSPGAATANEIVRKINTVSSIFEARVSANKTKVRIFARNTNDEEIRVSGGTANTALNFQTDLKFTTKLYLLRNNILKLLSKDGKTASIEAGDTAAYDLSGGIVHLAFVVDAKVNNILNVWFDPSDFTTPASVTAQEICDHLLARAPAVMCDTSSNDTRFTISSLTKRLASSKVRIVENFTAVFNEEAGVNVDRTSEFASSASNTTMFAVDNDYVYLGHNDVPFSTMFVKLGTPASADILPLFEYFRGAGTNAFSQIGVNDGTAGFTQDGHITWLPPHDWAKTTVEGVTAYWIRIQRTEDTLGIPPAANRIRVCGANEIFQFTETEQVGADKDYSLNRFVGQIELESSLQAGDRVTLGSDQTRAFSVSNAGNFSGLSGTTLWMIIDGVPQSYTFVLGDFADNSSALPSEVVTAIRNNFVGVTSVAIDGNLRVRVETNTFNGGTLEIVGDANAILGFKSGLIESFVAHQPALESMIGPFTFPVSASLLVIIDRNTANNLSVAMFKEGAVTTGTSSSIFADASLSATFPNDEDIVGMSVEFTSGANSGERRTISSYTAASGTVEMTSGFSNTPGAGDVFQIIPVTVQHVVSFMNNKQITLLSTRAEIRRSDAGTRVQVASRNLGEDAAVEIPGGTANAELGFPTEVAGVDAYKYFTGLMQLVQWTIDGRQDNPETYPGIRAAGVQVEAIEPVEVPVSASVEIVTTGGTSLASITNNVKSAITNYINNLRVGENVLSSEILVAVKGVSGVADARIVALSNADSVTGNIPVADNELARITEDRIGVG